MVNIDDWLPITASRKAKWWYSTFHNVTSMVGVGVLSLPYAMKVLGWRSGIVTLVISWIITLYTLWQMVEMHEIIPGKRFDRYYELGQHAFGEKLGLWIVVPQQLIIEVGLNITYMITGGKSLQRFHEAICSNCRRIVITYSIMIFSSVHFILSQLPNFNSTSTISLAGTVMSLSYSTVAWVASLYMAEQADNHHEAPAGNGGNAFEIFAALGSVAFAYSNHIVVLEIQATIPSKEGKPSKKPMWKGSIVAYAITALCYFPVAIIGYWAFDNSVDENILTTIGKPRWLMAAANMMIVINVIGSYQIYAMPVFDLMEMVLVEKIQLPPSTTLRLVTRTLYVAITTFMAIAFPFFGGILGFFGGFALAPTSYFLPCIIWLAICKPRKFSLSWITNWTCIVLGILLTIIAPIGGLWQIIINAPSYDLYG